MKKNKTISIPLEEPIYNELQRIAETEERTLTDTARRILKKGLETYNHLAEI